MYRVAQNKMSHQIKRNFSKTDGDFLTKSSGLKDERLSNLENWQSLDKFKYLNILCCFATYADEHFDNY